MKTRIIIIIIVSFAAWVVFQNNDIRPISEPISPQETKTKRAPIVVRNEVKTKTLTTPTKEPTQEIIPLSEDRIIEGEQLLTFKSRAAYLHFLQNSGQYPLTILDKIPELLTIRVSFDERLALRDFLINAPRNTKVSKNTKALVPEPLLEHRSIGLKDNPLQALGIQNNETWGQGITVAVLDSGIVNHESITQEIRHLDLLDDDSEIELAHGTSVASLIVGNGENIKGIAPQAQLIDIRVLNNEGQGNVFAIAQGILEATEAGAQIINLSLGTADDSITLQNAVNYAHSKGVIIVAAVGNNSAGQLAYPARYDGVIAVGATDANENHASFSNRGREIDITAPGVELLVAGLNNESAYSTGTSFSAPIVTASIAAEMSRFPGMSQEEIINNLYMSANDGGFPGVDPYYGHGTINLGRLEANAGTQSNTDLAASGFGLTQDKNTKKYSLYFSGENRGNTFQNPSITLNFGDREETFFYKNIAPSQEFYEIIKVNPGSPLISESQAITIRVNQPKNDTNPENNSKTIHIRPRSQ